MTANGSFKKYKVYYILKKKFFFKQTNKFSILNKKVEKEV